MYEVDTSTIGVLWREGVHGGYDQTIHFQTSSNNQVWTERNTFTVSANEPTVLRNTTINDLASSGLYLRLFASNALGISEMSDIWNITLPGINDCTVFYSSTAIHTYKCLHKNEQ